MSRTVGSLVGVSKQTEMLVMTIMTLWTNIFDMTLFELGTNLEQVWSVPLEITKFSPDSQNLIKILLSGVVFVRTFSLHLYIAFLIAMFWPVTFGTRPTLMLPWLTVSAVKNIGAGIVTFATGLYTCILYGPMRPACLRFFGSQILDMSPSIYMWIVGISLYRDLRKPLPIDREILKITEEEELNMALRRRKVKSMIDEDLLREQFESGSKFIGTSAVEVKEIFSPASFEEGMISRKISRSLDSLLDAMTAEAEDLEVEDFEPLDDWLKLPEKTAKLLGISMSEISRIKQNRQTSQDLPMYPVKAQKKQTNISNSILKYESPLKLLTKTSLYSPSAKPVRPTKSELKSPKDFLKLKSPSDFMQSVPESELRISNYIQDQEQLTYLDYCITETIFQANVESEVKPEERDDTSKLNKDTFINKWELKDMNIDDEFSSKKEPIQTSKENLKKPSVKSVSSNERQKSSEVIILQTDSNEQLISPAEPEAALTVISNKVSHEIGCQVSTLSKRILNASPREISEKFSRIPSSKVVSTKSRTIPIRPPFSGSEKRSSIRPGSSNSQHRVSNQNLSIKSKSFLSKNSSASPRGENSYLSRHLHKLELEKSIENNKFALDKFGMVSSKTSSEEGTELIFSSFEPKEKSDFGIKRKKFENISFKF